MLASAAQIEGQRAEQAKRQQEQAALMKLEKIRLDQTNRAQTLEEEAREAEQKVKAAHLRTVVPIGSRSDILIPENNAGAADRVFCAVRGTT